MCGIAGVLDARMRGDGDGLKGLARDMAARLAHRGPDGSGAWADARAGVALGHTRLSIIDVSPAGAQPMRSSCGRYAITYNGEIYNAEELARDLRSAGRRLRGHADTEVLIEAISVWGVRATLDRLIGMFAFAVWDRDAGQLSLARDRLGVKPLYWGRQQGRLVFASELKAFAALPDWQPTLNRDALAAYFRFAYVPAPHSIWRGIHKLRPGHLVIIDAQGNDLDETYWSLSDVAARGQEAPFSGSETEACDILAELAGDAVRRRLVSDVPLGAFLSGGMDSSTVVALMQAASTTPVRTFTIGFAEAAYDEAPFADAVATHLGTDHTEMIVTPDDARAVIPDLPFIYDEPFADSSQIPTFLVSKLTREHVTVALSGDGGDEVFAGYNRHVQAQRLARVPEALGQSAGAAMQALPPRTWDRLFALVPERLRPRQAGEKMHKLGAAIAEGPDGAYRRLVSQWEEPERLVPGAREPRGVVFDDAIAGRLSDPVARMQALDTLTYLPDDILTKVDRASMAVALEVRVPLLDHRVVEFAWSLPTDMKVRGGKGKWLLRQLAGRYVPEALTDRPKAGFGVPIGDWLRGPLRDWADDLLSAEALGAGGLLDPAPIRAAWETHLSGANNLQHPLWVALMFQAWRREWGV